MAHRRAWLTIYFTGLAWSGLNPRNYFTWFLEVPPALVAVVTDGLTAKRFPFAALNKGISMYRDEWISPPMGAPGLTRW